MNRSLHSRLATTIGLGMLILFAISGVVLALLLENALWTEFDAALRSRLFSLTQLVERDADGISFEWDETSPAPPTMFVEGETITAWKDAQVLSVFPPDAATLDRVDFAEVGTDIRFDDRPQMRTALLSFIPRIDEEDGELASDGDVITLAVGQSTSVIDTTINRLRWTIITVGFLGAISSIAIAWYAVGHGLRPLADVTKQVSRLRPDSLDQRISMDDTQPRELHPLLETLNAMLDRLEHAFEHERSFSADVAHELRTPLAGLQAKTELAIAKPRTADEHQETLTQCHRMILQTTAIVESLLATAKSSGETIVSEVYPESILLKLCEDMVAETSERQLKFKFQIPQLLSLKCDPRAIEIVLRNLLENALAYADCDSDIDVMAEQSPATTTLRIANAATDFPPEDVSKVFDRFWRRDTSRSETGNHSGLGLSLCRRMVESMNGTVEATCQHAVFTMTLRLPNLQLTEHKRNSAKTQMSKWSDCSGSLDHASHYRR